MAWLEHPGQMEAMRSEHLANIASAHPTATGEYAEAVVSSFQVHSGNHSWGCSANSTSTWTLNFALLKVLLQGTVSFY